MPDLIPILAGALCTLATAYSLGSVALRRVAAPRGVRLAAGSALLSLIVFALFATGLGSRYTFAAVAVAGCAAGYRWGRGPAVPAVAKLESVWGGLDRVTGILTGIVFAAYGVLYLVHALAPDTQPDSTSYHLGLVAEWIRLGHFPNRVGFFEMLPQGPEMLFAFAFAFGRHSAATLTHFGMLVMTVPLIMAIGRRLELPAWVPATASVFYVCAPVVGVTGISAYTEAALVLAVLAAFYSLLAWADEGHPAWLMAAGLAAGFCYSAKVSAGIVPIAAVFAVVIRSRQWRPGAAVALWASAVIAPWIGRNWVMSGNPFAPLFNSVFPNPYFHLTTERIVSQVMRSYYGVSLLQAPYELTLGGAKLQGLAGPLFLLTPLGLFALRRRPARLLWAAAVLLALPWFLNIGARFLMPALPFLALAIASALPRKAIWCCVLLQAASCWPHALDAWVPEPYAWHLQGFPWQAALRLETEDAYLSRKSPGYRLARMIDAHVPPGGRVLDIVGHARAYGGAAAVLGYWDSAEADRLFEGLRLALSGPGNRLGELSASWPEQELRAFKIVQQAAGPNSWSIHELRFLRGNDRIKAVWVRARPRTWEAAFAFDGNVVSRWSTWEPMRGGMELEADFAPGAILTGASAIVDLTESQSQVRFFGMGTDGRWKPVGGTPFLRPFRASHLKWTATEQMRRAGVRWILTSTGPEAPVGRSLAELQGEWGVSPAAKAGNVWLFHLE